MAVLNPIIAQQIAAPKPDDLFHGPRHIVLMREFAEENDLRESGEFTLDALKRGMRSGGSWGERYGWPGCDHDYYFKRAGRAAAVVSQPYDTSDVEQLRIYAAEKGLAMHMPPNPRASFWFPPHTYFIVLTAPSFGPVHWLEAQLNYDRDLS